MKLKIGSALKPRKLFGVTSFGASGKGKDVLKFMNYEPKDLVKFIKNSLKNE